MSDIICVTNRKLCREGFLTQLRRIASAHPSAIFLREKDLSPADYRALAQRVLPLCRAQNVPLILSGYPRLSAELRCGVQLSFPQRDTMEAMGLCGGISVHSVQEAAVLRESQARYLIAGHIWDTTCKAGTPGRGTDFLRTVACAVPQPVFAIGGVTPARMREVRAAGAAGACVMSALMTSHNPEVYLEKLKYET